MVLKQVKCKDCGWLGQAAELVGVSFTMGDPQSCCPSCGGDRLEEVEASGERSGGGR